MHFSWNRQTPPIIGLSPMADMTDAPFCTIVRSITDIAGIPILFREMVSSEAIVRENEKTIAMARFEEMERPLIQQIFGSDPDVMARAASTIVERFHPDGIDINMGCPAYKLTSNFNGAVLMKEPERAKQIVRAVKRAVGVPVSVKIRLGWSDPYQAREFAKVLEEAGASLITVHGRTKCQAYSGSVNWREIWEIKKRISIPVLANGDIVDGPTAAQALLLSRCDGVMIGRGALGNPWVFKEIAHTLDRHYEGALTQGRDDMPSLPDKIPVILRHAELMLERYGPHGIIQFRKHLPWYFKGIANAKLLHAQLMTVATIEQLRSVLKRSA